MRDRTGEALLSSPATPAGAAVLAPIATAAGAQPWVTYPTAFLEGAAVIIVEIAGARAMAPFFGTSLQVWTATITVTLFFLAAGYGVGGLLTKRLRPATLPMLFAIAGVWLSLYPLLRTPILEVSSANLGVALGSLFSATMLFGLPLMMLGAVSPVLIAYIDRRRPGAGSAAGRLFFTNTMGGLAGGWITAFALIPHSSLRLSLVTTGVGLIVLAIIWVVLSRSAILPLVIPLLLIGCYVLIFHQPQRHLRDQYDNPFEIVYSRQSGIGLLQVLDFHYSPSYATQESRVLLINGVIQGEIDRITGRPANDYIHNLHLLSHAHHPQAKSALQLGLGAGLMPAELARRGLSVTAVEIEPRIAMLAREFFHLPDSVDVRVSDARTYLRGGGEKFDLIFLDTFASESTAWYLLTVEAFQEMRDRLNPGGRLVINTVSYTDPLRPEMARIEASLLEVFPQALVYPEKPVSDEPDELINTTLVAGETLQAEMILPTQHFSRQQLHDLLSQGRWASARGRATTDDRSDLDYVQDALRVKWRTLIWGQLNSSLLWD